MSETIGAAQVELGVDASGVDAGVARAKKSIDSLGGAAAKAGQEGSKGIGDIGNAADKLDAATKRAARSIELQALAMGKTRSEFLYAKAALDGNTAALAPHIAKLAAAEKANQSFADSNKVLGTSFAALAGAATVAVAIVTAVAANTKGLIDSADAMQDLSQKTGIGVRELGKYELATRQSGTTMEAVAKGVKGLAGNLAEHGDALRKAGLMAKDADGAIKELADIFAAMPDSLEKTNLAVKLFGKSGMDLIPMLNLGSKGLEEAAKKSAHFAEAMENLAPQADKFNDTLAEIGMNSKVVGLNLANDLLPPLSKVVAKMAEAQQGGAGFLNALMVGLKTSDVASRSLDDLRERAASLQGTISALTSGGTQMPTDPVFGGKLHASVAELKILQTEIAARIAQVRTFQSSVRAIDNAIADAPARAEKAAAAVKKLQDALKDNPNAAGQLTDFQKLMNAAIDMEAVSAAQLLSNQKLTTSETALVKGLRDIDDGTVKATAAERASFDTKMKLVVANEQLFKIRETQAKYDSDHYEEMLKSNKTLDDEIEKLQASNAAIGQSKEAIAALAVERKNHAITIEEERLALNQGEFANEAENKLLKDKIAKLKQIRDLTADGATRQAMADAAKASTEEWKKGWEETDRLGREVFTAWAMDGSNAAKKIGDTLKTALLSAIYEASIKPIAFQIYSSATGALGMGGGLGQGLSAAATGTNLYSLAGGASGAGYGSFAMSGIGQELGLSASVMTDSMGIVSTEMTALGSSIGAAIPYVGAALLAIAAISKIASNGGTPTSSLGDSTVNYSARGDVLSQSSKYGGTNTATDAFVQGLEAAYTKAAKGLGIGAVATTFAYARNTGEDGKNPQFGLTGSAGNSTFTQGETTASDTAIQLAASRAVFAALQGSQLPGYLAKVFDGLSAGAMTLEQINNVEVFAAQLKSVRDALTETRTPLQVLQDTVASAFTELNTSAVTFKTDFVAAIDAGITPDQLATWSSLQKSMTDLATASGDTSTALDTVTRSVADIASERKSLQDQLDNLTLSNADLLAKQRSALDASNQALFDQVTAAQAAKVAAEDLAKTLSARADWQDKLDLAKGSISERDLALRNDLARTTDATTEALIRQTYAQEDLNAAAEKVAATAAEIAAAKSGWQDRLDVASGSISARDLQLRADLASTTDAATQAIIRQTYAQEDLATAAAKAAAVLATRASWQDKLDVLTGTATARELQLRQDLANTTDTTTQVIIRQTYAQEDLATAAAKAAAVLATRASWQDKLDVLTGSITERDLQLRRDLASTSDVTTQAIIRQVYAQQDLATAATDAAAKVATARSDLVNAYQRESSALQSTIDKFAGFSKSLLAFRDSLQTGTLSPLSPEAKYTAAKTLFSQTYSLAKAGDPAAIESLQGVSEQFLTASQQYNASSTAYVQDFAAVSDALAATASTAMSQAGMAQAQLTALQGSVQGLADINTSVISVHDAIVALQGALAIQQAAVAAVQAPVVLPPPPPPAPPVVPPPVPVAPYVSSGGATFTAANDTWTDKTGALSATTASLKQTILDAAHSGNVRAIYDAGKPLGLTLADIDRIAGAAPDTIEAWARANGLPLYGSGGMANGLFAAGDRGTELMYTPAPVRVLTNSQSNAAVIDGGKVTELLNRLIAAVDAGNTQRGAGVGVTVDKLDEVVVTLAGTRRQLAAQR